MAIDYNEWFSLKVVDPFWLICFCKLVKFSLTTIQKEKAFLPQKENREETTEESSENGDLSKEIFTTSVLRHAYEDACLRHVVKNCYTVRIKLANLI